MLTIKMLDDEWFGVKIQIFNGERFGIAAGRDLETTIKRRLEFYWNLNR